MAFAHGPPLLAGAVSSPVGGRRDGSVCLPERQGQRSDFRGYAAATMQPAVSQSVVHLKKRSEFLAVAATGRRWVAPSFVLQVGPRSVGSDSGAQGHVGLGFTATKRLGNAVVRNRAKRRLREAARLVFPDSATMAHNYVLIARAEILTCVFRTLVRDLETALLRVITVKPRQSHQRSVKRK